MSALPDDVVADYIAAMRLADAAGDTDLGTRLIAHMFAANEYAEKAAWRPVLSVDPSGSTSTPSVLDVDWCVVHAPRYVNTC